MQYNTYMRQIEKILQELAGERNLNYQSFADGWIIKFDQQFVTGYHFSINNAAASRLCDDKSATSELLAEAGLPVISHEFFMEMDELRLHRLMNRYDSLVLKPNQGSGGLEVEKISNQQDLMTTAEKILAKGNFLAVAPFIEFKNEFRLIILKQEVQLIYVKQIQEGWKHNLGLGAIPQILESHPELEKLALQATKTLDINFASVDIAESADGFKILEVNSGVMMEKFSALSDKNYQTAKKIYGKALKL